MFTNSGEGRLLVEVLLSRASLFLYVATRLLLLVALDGSDNGIPFSASPVNGPVNVAFRLGGSDFSWT